MRVSPCMNGQDSGAAAARQCCSEITHTSDPGNKSCALTVSFLLSFSEAAHDGPVTNPFSNMLRAGPDAYDQVGGVVPEGATAAVDRTL